MEKLIHGKFKQLAWVTELISGLLWISVKQVWPHSDVCQLMWLKHKVQLRVVGDYEKNI